MEKHMIYLNVFFHLVIFSCIIFHLFSHAVHVLCHATHCSRHNIYLFGSILDCFVEYPNRLTLLVNYPNNGTAIDIPLCITLTNFFNVNNQPIMFVKNCNDFILPFLKGLNWIICVWNNGNCFLMELLMGWILILTWRLIANNFNKWSMKPQNSSSKNTFKLFLCVMFVLWKKSASTNKITNSGYVFISSRLGGVPP